MATSARMIILIVVIVSGTSLWRSECRGGGDEHSPKSRRAREETIERVHARFLRGQIRALRLEAGFVEEWIARAKLELARELRELERHPDSAHRHALDEEIREIYVQREARLTDRLSIVQDELQRLEHRLVKQQSFPPSVVKNEKSAE